MGGSGEAAPTLLWQARQNSGAERLAVGDAAAHSLAPACPQRRENGGRVDRRTSGALFWKRRTWPRRSSRR